MFKDIIDHIEPNEFAMLLLGVGVLIFTVSNWRSLQRLPYFGMIMTVFYLLLATWIATVLEGKTEDTIWNSLFNLIEHAGFAASSVLTAVWCWKVLAVKKKTG